MGDTKIFVISHKKIEIELGKQYVPVQVGNAEDLNYLRDNTGDNISERNANYCELTGIYWVWKNYQSFNNAGICHYRRYFVKNNKLLTEKYINKVLDSYDIILPKKFYFKRNVWENYFLNGQGKEKDLVTTKKVIQEKYPEYIEDFDYVMSKNYGSYCNMLITSKENFNNYCNWLFDILFEVEKNTDLSDYTKQEARIYGYLSELLLNVWVRHNKLKVKECKMKKIDETLKDKINMKIHMIYYRLIRWNLF